MSNAVVQINQQTWTPDQMKLITEVVAKGATPDELKLFLYRCQHMGLDPLKPGQIHFIKYKPTSPGTIVVGIEGFRSIAHRTGKLNGIKRGALKDEKGKLVGAWAEVYRSDWKECAREEVPIAEYDTGYGPWQNMKETMIKKVAEAAALRMAFPNDLGGVYASEEMDQAETTRGGVYPEQPPEDGSAGFFSPGDHVVTISKKYKGKKLKDIDLNELRSFILWLEDEAAKTGKPLGRGASDVVKYGSEYIIAIENGTYEE